MSEKHSNYFDYLEFNVKSKKQTTAIDNQLINKL